MSRTGAAVGMGRTKGRVRAFLAEKVSLCAPHPWREQSMNLTDPGQEGQLVSVAFDMCAFKVRVDRFKGRCYEEHVCYTEPFSRYQCIEGIEKAPRGRLDPDLLAFESTKQDGKEIGVRVGREFYQLLPFGLSRDVKCTYAVRPGVTGVPTSTGHLLALFILKQLSPESGGRMVGESLELDEVSEAVPDVPESAVKGEAVPAPVPDREDVKAVARVEAVVPESVRGHAPVGRKLPLAYIPGEMFALGSFDGLCLGAIETYRIVRTFAKQAGGGSEFYYNQVGVAQLCGLLEGRKADMLVRRKDEKRREVEKIRTSLSRVKVYVVRLMKRGLLERVSRGRPKRRKDGRSYVSRYQVAMSEKQRFKMLIERKKRRGAKRPYARLLRGLVGTP
ncbi:hypothetical protein ES705_30535 [subsurface metagenome]